MRLKIRCSSQALLGALIVVPMVASAEWEGSANVTLTSDYVFRGVSQTDEDPAIQGGFDLSHDSGFYIGAWASNVDFNEEDSTDPAADDAADMELDLKVGYAKITADSRVGGTAVFTLIHTPTGTLLYEAGVPASEQASDFSLVVDSTGHRRTGVALVNPPGSAPASLILRLYDQDFNLLQEKQLQLATGEHYARFITEIFPEVEGVTEMLGSMTVHSGTPVAAVTLRETDDPAKQFPDTVPTLSTFPVIPGRGDE